MAKDKATGDDGDPKQLEDLYEQLSKPFPPDCVEWLILNAKDVRQGGDFWVYAIASPYIQKESAEDRADEVFGPDNWENHFSFPDEHGRFHYWIDYEWNGKQVRKKAGGSLDADAKGKFSDSDFEIALSYAEKRCWQKIGIGRYLKLVKPKKVVTKLDFQAGWERYSFQSDWQKKKQGQAKYITFYWKEPTLPNKALPQEYRDQSFDDTESSERQTITAATEEQWEKMEAYLEYAPAPEDEQIREVIYNQIVDENREDSTGEVTYERKKLTKESAEMVIGRLEDKYGWLVDGIPGGMSEEEAKKNKESKQQTPDGVEEGQQGDLLPNDGKQQAKNMYDPPAKGEPED